MSSSKRRKVRRDPASGVLENDDRWKEVAAGADSQLEDLKARFDGDPQLGLATLALAMAYLMAITRTTKDRRAGLYECIEERLDHLKKGKMSVNSGTLFEELPNKGETVH